jgi:acetolactate synthase-1/2/3 large subunit
MIGTDAFQEVDTYGMHLPVVKHAWLVRDAADLAEIVPRAFSIAASGRPGPVLIDIPKDIQKAMISLDTLPDPGMPDPPESCAIDSLSEAADMICRARRPVLVAGGGIIHSGASEVFRELAHRTGLPVVSTLMGLGAFPVTDPQWLGMLGMHGTRAANHVMGEADLIAALGMRFDDRATGNIQKFCPDARVIHLDIDPAEFNKIRFADCALAGDAAQILQELVPLISAAGTQSWAKRIAELKEQWSEESPELPHPLALIRGIAGQMPEDTIVVTDVGQHQMWTAQAWPFAHPRTFLTSGGLGTMGFGLPTAIGAALACPDRRVVCFSGDGSLLMNIQELAVLAETGADVSLIVMNNGHLGLVRQQQELFYGKRIFASEFSCSPDFTALARSFGLPAERIEEGCPDVTRKGPRVFDVPVCAETNAFPMVPPGAANIEMIGENR